MISLLGLIASGYQVPTSPVGISLDDRTYTANTNLQFNTVIPYQIALPSTAVAGDLILIFATTDSIFSTPFLYTPSGWTEHFSWYGSTPDNTGQLWSKVIDSSDVAAGSVGTLPYYSSTRDIQCWSMIATGVDTTTPVSNVGTKVESAGSEMTLSAITPTADGLAVGFWGYDGGDGEPTTLTSGWTKLEEEDIDPSFSGLLSGFATLPTTSSISTGNLKVTFQLNDGFGGVIVNLKAA